MQQLFINYLVVSFSNSSSPCLISSDFLSSLAFERDNDDDSSIVATWNKYVRKAAWVSVWTFNALVEDDIID